MSDVLFDNIELVPIERLKPYEKNPRKGNVKAIAESLATNKQYRPIVVQKSTRKILAGNHTWLAAKSLGWDKVAAVLIDVDSEAAKRIVLADNRTNDLAEYDDAILAELLQSLDSTEGTGYSETDVQAILNTVMDSVDEIDDQLAEDVFSVSDDVADEGGPKEAFSYDEEEDDPEQDEFESAQAQLQGVL